MTLRAELIRDIEAFLKRTGMTPTRFSAECGDRTLMITLRAKNRDLKLSTVERIRAFMRDFDAKKKAA